MITMTDAEALELQGFLNTSKAHIEALAEASAGWQARAEAADATLASCNRARQAAEAENDRLRKQVAQAKVDGANEECSLHWMRENTEIAALRKQVATLRTALAYYVEARNVTNWGMEEDEDIGDVARAALEATA